MSQQALPRGLALCFPAVPPGLCLRAVSVPCRGRSHSAENAAVLTLQKTQRKDWRFQTPLSGITDCSGMASGKGHGGGKGNAPAGMNPLPQAASTFLFVPGYVRQN